MNTKQKLEELKARAAIRGLLKKPYIQKSLRRLEYDFDPQHAAIIEYMIEQADEDLPPPDIPLGVSPKKGKRLGLYKKNLDRGTLLIGSPGTGKTLLMKRIALHILRENKHPLIIIDDSPNREWTSLVRSAPKQRKISFFSLTQEGLFNPLTAPPNMEDPDEWDDNLASVIASNLGLVYAEGSVMELLQQIREEHGYSTILLLQELITKMMRSKAFTRFDKTQQYISSLDNALKRIPRRYRRAFSSCKTGKLAECIQRMESIVITTGTSKPILKIFVELLILYIVEFQGNRKKPDPYVVIAEEVQHHVLRRKPVEELSIASQMLETATRKSKVWMIMSAHRPSEMDESALNAVANKIAFGLENPEDRDEMASYLSLDYGQKSIYKDFDAGKAFLKIPGQDPEFIIIPELKEPKEPQPESEAESEADYRYAYETEPNTTEQIEPEDIDVYEPQPLALMPPLAEHSENQPSHKKGYLTFQEEKILETWVRVPYSFLTEFKKQHLSETFRGAKTSIRQVNEFLNGMIISDNKTNAPIFQLYKLEGTGKPGPPPTFLAISKAGEDYATEYMGLELPENPRGCEEHSAGIYCIKRHYEPKCIKVEIGKTMKLNNGETKEIDLLFTMHGSFQIAVEVNYRNTQAIYDDCNRLLRCEKPFHQIIVVNMLASEKDKVDHYLKPLIEEHPHLKVEEFKKKYLKGGN